MDGDGSFLAPPPIAVVTKQKNKNLTMAIWAKEVRSIIWSIAKDKAPKPNGFSLLFSMRY